jgi:hypothetical protein
MLPVILVAVGAYLIGDSVLGDKKSFAKGGEIKAKYKVGDELFSYQNKDYAAPIAYTTEYSFPNEKVKYKLKLKDGYSNWINEESLHKTKQKEYADGGMMAKGGKVDEKYEIELFFKGLSGDNRKIGKYVVTQKTLDNLETYLREDWSNDISLDVIDESDKKPTSWANLKTDVYAKYKEKFGKMAKGGELEWANEENEKLGKWLLDNQSGKKILEDSKNSKELEKNVRDYAKEHNGIAGLEMDDEDEGLEWVTFDDLYKELKSRSKMAKGGKLVGKQKNLDVNKNGKLDAEDFKMLRGEKMAKGGKVMTDKQMIAKLKKKFAKYQGNDFDFDKDDNFKVDGYNVEVFDWKEEDEMNDYIAMNSKDNYLVPYSSDDDNYYLIVVPKDKMAKGGATKK